MTLLKSDKKRKALIRNSIDAGVILIDLICEECGEPQITEEESGELEEAYSSRKPVYIEVCECKPSVKFHVEFNVEGNMIADDVELSLLNLEQHIKIELDSKVGRSIYMGNCGNTKVTNFQVKEM